MQKIKKGVTMYLTTQQYSDKLSVSRRTVQAWITSGKLKAERYGRDWLIDSEAPRPLDRRYVEHPIRNRRK
jgi:excisionase family DNA binding protein